MATTLGQQYEQVCDEIAKVSTSGQGYSIQGRSLTRAEYKSMTDSRDSLFEKIQRFGYNYDLSTITTSNKATANVIFS